MSDDILARVYAATTPEEISAAYADWAASYDRDTVKDGYHLPFTIAAWVARHVAPGAGPLRAPLQGLQERLQHAPVVRIEEHPVAVLRSGERDRPPRLLRHPLDVGEIH